MTNPLETPDNNEALISGALRTLETAESFLSRSANKLGETPASKDLSDFGRELRFLERDTENLRILPGNMTAELIVPGYKESQTHLVISAMKPFDAPANENDVREISITKSGFGGTETFVLRVDDGIFVDRSRVDSAGIKGGTWEHNWELKTETN